MTDGMALAQAAERLVGCRFRLHGRDPGTGLDCIGLLAAALRDIGRRADFPTGYRLRTGAWPALPAAAAAHGFTPAEGEFAPGDVMFIRPGPGQLHLAIVALAPGWLVEAHAGLGRVALSPGPPLSPGPQGDTLVQRWRMAAQA